MAIPSAMGGPGGLREQSPMLPRQDIATTSVSPTATGVVLISVRIKVIAVIVRQFVAISDIPEGDDPDRASRLCDLTVGIAGVVAIASRIPEDRAINIVAVIEGKDVHITLC
jgi:hypothetical protein